MTQVEIAVTVTRPPEEAFAWLSNFEQAPLWQSGVVETHLTSPPPLRQIEGDYNRLKQVLESHPAGRFRVRRRARLSKARQPMGRNCS